MKRKLRRGYVDLYKATHSVSTTTTVIVILLVLGSLAHGYFAVLVAEEMKFFAFLLAFFPYVIYIMIIGSASYVINRVLEHLVRMEVLAFEGRDVFESDPDMQ